MTTTPTLHVPGMQTENELSMSMVSKVIILQAHKQTDVTDNITTITNLQNAQFQMTT